MRARRPGCRSWDATHFEQAAFEPRHRFVKHTTNYEHDLHDLLDQSKNAAKHEGRGSPCCFGVPLSPHYIEFTLYAKRSAHYLHITSPPHHPQPLIPLKPRKPDTSNHDTRPLSTRTDLHSQPLRTGTPISRSRDIIQPAPRWTRSTTQTTRTTETCRTSVMPLVRDPIVL